MLLHTHDSSPIRFLTLQDVPRTADRAPSRTFYLWKADADGATTTVTIELLLATGNVHSRLAHELAERTEVGMCEFTVAFRAWKICCTGQHLIPCTWEGSN